MEPVYESWAINRIVYSIVAATGFKLPEGKTERRARLPLQAEGCSKHAYTHTHRTRNVDAREKSSHKHVTTGYTDSSNLLAIVKLNNQV